ncbi:MAG: signal peptide peptidase SppA [Actinomycetota bacterium]|nr:signal peptide peptidase SppA [Actinomycetota bacterium]
MARTRAKRLLAVFGVIGIVAALWVAAIVVGRGSGERGTSATQYDEELLREGSSDEKIALINVVGEIFSDPEELAEGASDSNILRQLEQARDDESVAGVIVNLETPGGSVTASDAIYRKVLELRRRDKPVVALMGDVAASGGYYIAAGADEVVAHPYTWTGSIGVIALLPNFEQAAGKLGVTVAVVKSGALKDAGSPFRALTEEERALFQRLIDEAYAGFVNVVSTGRKLNGARTRELADGRIYSGIQAKELGLVDYLGDRDLAFRRAKELARSPGASLVRYSRGRSFFEQLIPFRLNAPDGELLKEVGIQRRPGAAYLWLP